MESLKRTLSFRDLIVFGLIAMNPMASLSMYGLSAFRSEGNPILSYIIAFVAVLFTAMSFGKMAGLFPSSGSSYTFASKGIHPTAGFYAGWTMLLDYVLIPGGCLLGASLYLHVLIPAVPLWAWILLVNVIVLLANYFGVQVAAKFNTIMTVYLLFAIAAFLGAAIYYIVTNEALILFDTKAVYNSDTFGVAPVISGAALAIMCYFGFDAMTTLSEETNTPPKKIGKAILIAISLLTVLFLATTYVSSLVIPDYTSISDPETAISDVILTVGGQALQLIILVGMIVSYVGLSVAVQSSASRLLYAKGRDNILPRKFFGYLHPKTKTPTRSILLLSLTSILLPLSSNLLLLTELSSFGGLCGFVLVNLAVIVHAVKSKQRSGWLRHYLLPSLGFIVTLYILFGLSDLAKIVGFGWIIVGTVVYLASRKFGGVREHHPMEPAALAD
ncbi:APC family permease [Cohnella sp. AR92]|uniref:APC family permease n=1 Tax=Cohnella sp. AR92 TaxID=648716 RepID=UPI000F8E5FBD|nr:APC family permease [Cohnella sp. AR92]RUS47423.1 APC family permease [Cohnella sp. AR92]